MGWRWDPGKLVGLGGGGKGRARRGGEGGLGKESKSVCGLGQVGGRAENGSGEVEQGWRGTGGGKRGSGWVDGDGGVRGGGQGVDRESEIGKEGKSFPIWEGYGRDRGVWCGIGGPRSRWWGGGRREISVLRNGIGGGVGNLGGMRRSEDSESRGWPMSLWLEHEHVVMNMTQLESGRNTVVQFRRTSLTEFLALSVRFFNAYALDSLYLLVLITGTSQSRQHESRKSPTAVLFDVDTRRISIVTVNTKEYHSDVLA
ncbi:hypothetical protein Tco_1272322 [Tanacetum coccineum]